MNSQFALTVCLIVVPALAFCGLAAPDAAVDTVLLAARFGVAIAAIIHLINE